MNGRWSTYRFRVESKGSFREGRAQFHIEFPAHGKRPLPTLEDQRFLKQAVTTTRSQRNDQCKQLSTGTHGAIRTRQTRRVGKQSPFQGRLPLLRTPRGERNQTQVRDQIAPLANRNTRRKRTRSASHTILLIGIFGQVWAVSAVPQESTSICAHVRLLQVCLTSCAGGASPHLSVPEKQRCNGGGRPPSGKRSHTSGTSKS